MEQQKIQPSRQLAQLLGGLGILDIDAQLNCIKTKWIVIKFHQCSPLERSHAILIEVNS